MKRSFLSKFPKKAITDFLKKVTFLLCSASVFLLLGYYIPQNTEYEYTNTQKTSVLPQNISSSDETLCTLVLKNGNLVVCYDDGTTNNITQADTSVLTEYDKQLLSEGICATEQEIYELLEALMS